VELRDGNKGIADAARDTTEGRLEGTTRALYIITVSATAGRVWRSSLAMCEELDIVGKSIRHTKNIRELIGLPTER